MKFVTLVRAYTQKLLAPLKVPVSETDKLLTTGNGLKLIAEKRAENIKAQIIAKGPNAVVNGRLTITVDHTTLPNHQRHEEYTSNIGVSLSVIGENERASYMLDFGPVKEKTDFATIAIVRETLADYGLSPEFESKNIPVMGDGIMRGAAKQMSSVHGICIAHSISNLAKSAILRKAPEFYPDMQDRMTEVTNVLQDGNKVIPRNQRNDGPTTLNIYLKQYELSGEN